MIKLMTPEGFAELMDTMWPELLSAMPLGMGGMMRFMGKLGPFGKTMLFMMKPMPELMPKAMDNLMPHILPDVVPLVTPKLIRYLTTKK
ncbi:TPA: hypothetical protein EYP66_19520 [Candidatus Poribacteria bacterium]|nr:hypothetical protein [Candidatus Poribacteria bacterium]